MMHEKLRESSSRLTESGVRGSGIRLSIRFVLAILGLTVFCGAATTAWILSREGWGWSADVPRAAIFTCLVAAPPLLAGNLVLRFFRWYLLIRGIGIRPPERRCFQIYLTSFAFNFTPFYIGPTLYRVIALRAVAPASTSRSAVVGVSVAELFYDAAGLAVLGVVGAVLLGHGLDAWPLALVVVASAFPWPRFALSLLFSFLLNLAGRFILGRGIVLSNATFRGAFSFQRYSYAMVLSVAAWSLPIILFVLLAHSVSPGWEFASSLRAVPEGALMGSSIGAPGGTGTSGAFIRQRFQSFSGVALPAYVIFLYRAGTYWLALATGFVFLAYSIYQRRSAGGGTIYHFDAIADTYESELPPQWNAKMIARKTDAMLPYIGDLKEQNSLALDLGCGQGHFARWFENFGIPTIGHDYSFSQARHAKSEVDKVVVADGAVLPYADACFDFIYTINVIHHLPNRAAQESAIAEIRRVLKPGGILFLHEINTQNPLFRFYAGYIYPVLRAIDTGEEWWIRPGIWEPMRGWTPEQTHYFTFLPDFFPEWANRLCGPIEAFLEKSNWRHLSAHYTAVFKV